MSETATEVAAVVPAQGAIAEAPQPGSDPLMVLIQRAATDEGFSVDKLEKLLDVKERWDAEEARKSYVAALAEFKRAAPTLVKDKKVSFADTKYSHATLGQVATAVAAALAEHGMSHGWSVDQHNGTVTVTCTLTHECGHRENVSMTAPPDDSGKKNAIQRIGSTVTYLERYTLLAITGLAAHEQDDDGETAGVRRNTKRRKAQPRDVTPTRNAPKAIEAQPPADPETGELLQPSPIPVPELPDRGGADWVSWTLKLAAALNAAQSSQEIDAWMDANETPLKNLGYEAEKNEGFVRWHQRLLTLADERREAFSQTPGALSGEVVQGEPEPDILAAG